MIKVEKDEAIKIIEEFYEGKSDKKRIIKESLRHLNKQSIQNGIYIEQPLDKFSNGVVFIFSKFNKVKGATSQLSINSAGIYEKTLTNSGNYTSTSMKESMFEDDISIVKTEQEKTVSSSYEIDKLLTKNQIKSTNSEYFNNPKLRILTSNILQYNKDNKQLYQSTRREIQSSKTIQDNQTLFYDELTTLKLESGENVSVYRDAITNEEKVFIGDESFNFDKDDIDTYIKNIKDGKLKEEELENADTYKNIVLTYNKDLQQLKKKSTIKEQ